MGAARKIVSKCLDLIDESCRGSLTDESGKQIPVLESVYKEHKRMIEEFFKSLGIEVVGKAAGFNPYTGAGYNAGQLMADNLNLHNGLSSANEVKLLG